MKKITLLLGLMLMAFSFQVNAQTTVGEGTSTGSSLSTPINPYYEYSYSQIIYKASDINTSGDITAVTFEMSNSNAIENSDDNIDLWIGHTTKTEFSSTTDWVDVSTLDQKMVNGSLTKTGTTITFTFSTPFTYNGIDNIIIATDANEPSYDGSADLIVYTAVSSNVTLHHRSDTVNSDPTSPEAGTLSSISSNITFVGITQSCPTPLALAATAITATQAELSWTEGGTASLYNLEVVTAGTVPTGTPTDTGVANSYTKTGLAGGTNYEFYVQADCTGGDLSAWAGPFLFSTECVVFSAPYSENFNFSETGSSVNATISNCWSFIDGGQGYGYVSENDGSNSFYMYNSYDSSGDYILISPETSNLSNGTFRVQYDVDAAADKDLVIGTMSDPTDASTFTAIETVTLTSSSYESFTTNIPSGTDNYLAFKHGQNQTYNSYYIDNIVIEALPSCLEPSDLTASNISTTGAELSWTEGGTASLYNVEVVTAGTTATGTATDAGVANPFTKTGLIQSTDYEFYVQADCTGGDVSAWSGPYAFTTECIAFSAPYSENFDTVAVGSSVNETLPNCWNFIDGGTGYGYVSLNDGSNSFRMYNASDSSGDYILVSPETTNLSNGTLRVTYDVDGAVGQDLIIGTMSDPADASTFTTLETVTLTSSSYESFITNIPSGTDNYLAFKHGKTGTYDSYYIDNIVVLEQPSCLEPSALTATVITATGAELSWTEEGTASLYNVEVVTAGTTPTGTATDVGVANPFTKTGLTATTDYEFYVQADCTGGDVSAWSGPYSFTTACDTISTFPFTEEFEEITTDVPDCWNVSGTTITASYHWYSTANGHDGSRGVRFNSYYNNSGRTSELITPLFDLTSLVTPELSFWFKNPTGGNYEVLISTDAGTSFTSLETGLTGSDWVEKTYDLSAYNTSNVVIKFFGTSNYGSGDAYLYLDGVSVVDGALSIDDFESQSLFNYYPNPVNNQLSLRAQANIQNVAVYNMLGQEVITAKPNTMNSDVNMSALQTGAYFVKVTINGNTETIRVIKN